MDHGSKMVAVLFVMVFIVGICPGAAQAGIWDKINQATQAVQQVQSTGERAVQTGSNIKKATTNNAQDGSQKKSRKKNQGESQGQFELTPTTNPIKGTWGDKVTCAGPNSATCMNGMDNLVNCSHQTKGYFFRLLADKLEQKLQEDYEEADLVLLQEDVDMVKKAIETDVIVDVDPNERHRHMSWLSDEEQQELNALNIKYVNEVRDDCDKRFGGMSNFSH